ncbi:MAG TPA: ZIP family metal transporter [Candidatus Paceibacterota bacterium]
MTLTLIAIGAFVATLLGGLLAIKWSDKLHLVLGFSAGALIGVAFFDLLPEALEIGGQFFDSSAILLATAIGFVLYLLLDRTFFTHCHEEGHSHHSKSRGTFGAGSLSFHSFLDGVAVGIAFHVSPAMGAVVAAAVLAHDFSDGINTVSMILRHGGSKKAAMKWLATDAIAPVLGIASTFLFTIPESFVGIILAVFCGFFLYIGASDLLPESHHNHPTHWTTIATIVGMAVIYVAIHFAHAHG